MNTEDTIKSSIDLLCSCLGACNVFEKDIHEFTYVDESMCPFEIKEVTIDEFREYNGDYVYFLGHSADGKYFYFKSMDENWPHKLSVLKIDSNILREYAKYLHDTYMTKFKADNKDNFDEIYAEEIKNNTWQERCEIGE